jgi:hypothetical protein
MIRFDREPGSIDLDHAVPSAIGLKIPRIGIVDRVVFLELGEIGHHRSAAIRIHAQHSVIGSSQTVRASGCRQERVQRVADEGDVGNSAHPTAIGG